MIMRSIFNRTPLPPNQLCTLPPGAIKPEGWLKERLDREARRIEEDLEGYFPGATGESAWLGGPSRDIEGDARALCSLILIAFLSEREPLKQVVGTFVDHLVASQREDGDFGPEHLTDWWPRMLMLRVLRQYVLATRAKEPLKLMDRFFRFQLEALPDRPLVGKSCSRAAENMLAALWLYNITGQPHLLRLCRLLSAQSLNWTDELHIFPHIRDTARMRPWANLQEALEREGDLDGTNQRVNAREFYLTRAEDVAVGLRSPGVINLFKSGFKEMSAFGVGWPRYMKSHGVALDMFTGDLHLAGPDPARGMDLNALAEALHSVGVLLGTGDAFDPALGDLFEKLALNAPQGMEVRPRLIQVNHIGSAENYNAPREAYESKKRPLDLADGITAAYADGLWYATEDEGLTAVSYAPCTLYYVAGGGRVRVRVEGNYPYEPKARIAVETRSTQPFPIHLRIPGWADQAILTLPDGELMQLRGGEIASLRRTWAGRSRIHVEFSVQPRLTRWARRSGAVEYGPLLMALDLSQGQSPGWALEEGAPMKAGDSGKVLVKAAPIEEWDGLLPIAPEALGEARVLTLVPFHTTDRRMAQFPLLSRRSGAQ